MNDIIKLEKAIGNGLFGWQTVYGYLTQFWVWRVRFHVFHKPEPGLAHHDHAWPFWTFPLQSYVEDVLNTRSGEVRREVVKAWRLHYRPASHTHKYVGRFSGIVIDGVPKTMGGKVRTICVRGAAVGEFSYWTPVRGKIARHDWRRYLRHVGSKPPLNRA